MNRFLIRALILIVLYVSSIFGHAQPTSGVPRLVGIVSLPDKKWAVVENPLCRQSNTCQYVFSDMSALASSDGQVPMTVDTRRIESSVGEVTLRLDQTNQIRLRLEGSSRHSEQTMVLHQVSLTAMLSLYAEISGRTVLRHPLLLTNSFEAYAVASSRSTALAVLDRTLGLRDIVTKLDGEKFVMVVPKTLAQIAVPESGQIQVSLGNSLEREDELVTTRYAFYEIRMLAVYYASLQGLEIDLRNSVSTGVGHLEITTQANLTKVELGYAFKTLLAWQGLKMIRFGEAQARIVPIESK